MNNRRFNKDHQNQKKRQKSNLSDEYDDQQEISQKRQTSRKHKKLNLSNEYDDQQEISQISPLSQRSQISFLSNVLKVNESIEPIKYQNENRPDLIDGDNNSNKGATLKK